MFNDEFYLGLTHAQTSNANKLLVFISRRNTVQCEGTISCSDHRRAGAAEQDEYTKSGNWMVTLTSSDVMVLISPGAVNLPVTAPFACSMARPRDVEVETQ